MEARAVLTFCHEEVGKPTPGAVAADILAPTERAKSGIDCRR